LKLTDVAEVHTASIIALMMEAVSTSETSVNFNVTTRRYIPEDSKLRVHKLVLFQGAYTLVFSHILKTCFWTAFPSIHQVHNIGLFFSFVNGG
jgi:hypothetical protein